MATQRVALIIVYLGECFENIFMTFDPIVLKQVVEHWVKCVINNFFLKWQDIKKILENSIWPFYIS